MCLLSLTTLMPIIEFTLLVITEEVKDVTNINISQDSLDQDVKAITFDNSTDETQSKINETQLKVNETQSKVNETQTKVKVDIEVKKRRNMIREVRNKQKNRCIVDVLTHVTGLRWLTIVMRIMCVYLVYNTL